MKVGLESRLRRIEGRRVISGELDGLPEGMATTLLYGVAVHLGGFPTPAEPQTWLDRDDIFTAVDRALGYPDATERRYAHDAYDNEWLGRFSDAVGRLCLLIGLPTDDPRTRDEVTLVAFVAMLDRIAEAHPEFGSPSAWPQRHPWPSVNLDMDAWITSAGFSPASIRALARGGARG